MPMINELMGWDFNFAFLPYGKYYQLSVKLFIESGLLGDNWYI